MKPGKIKYVIIGFLIASIAGIPFGLVESMLDNESIIIALHLLSGPVQIAFGIYFGVKLYRRAKNKMIYMTQEEITEERIRQAYEKGYSYRAFMDWVRKI